MNIFHVEFWRDTAERAARTAAQGALLAWGATELPGVVSSLPPWATLGYGATSGAVLAVLTALAVPPSATTARRAIADQTEE